jgi:hypothetical protein
MAQSSNLTKAPVNDAIIAALSSLVADSQSTREPSHYDIESQFKRAGLADGDPSTQGRPVGKAKRVRGVLEWGLANNIAGAEAFSILLLELVRGKGGFRLGSPNFIGEDAINELREAYRHEGLLLTEEGRLTSQNLEFLSGRNLTEALKSYVRRAQKGHSDAALLVGTSKDLMEATAAHVLTEKYGNYSHQDNFPTLLAQAFIAAGLAVPQKGSIPDAKQRLQCGLYESACAVNGLRNKQGTGHGKPWLSTVSDNEARSAIQLIDIVSELLLESAGL